MSIKKSVKTIYIVLFILLIALPLPTWRVCSALGAFGLDAANYENRQTAEKPVLTRQTASLYPTQYETWFDENMPFRDVLLTLNGMLEYYVLHSTDQTGVLVGKDGWLYYCGAQANDEDPIADYKGTNLFMEDELSQIYQRMEAAKKECEFYGKRFVVMFVPNKERMHSEYMPDSYGDPRDGRLKQVNDFLTEKGFDVVNTYDALTAYKEAHPDDQIYRKYDTHWNWIGGYIAARQFDTFLQSCRLKEPDAVERAELPPQNYDLARLIHLGNVLTDDHETMPVNYWEETGETAESGETADEADPASKLLAPGVTRSINDTFTEYVYNNSSESADPRHIFIIGDSFSPMMTDYIASDFAGVTFDYYYNYTPDMLREYDPDVVVYEVNERYLMNLKRFTLDDLMPIVQAE